LLNDPVLETRVLWDFKLSTKIKSFTFFAHAKAAMCSTDSIPCIQVRQISD
jgi:hypothetical protein